VATGQPGTGIEAGSGQGTLTAWVIEQESGAVLALSARHVLGATRAPVFLPSRTGGQQLGQVRKISRSWTTDAAVAALGDVAPSSRVAGLGVQLDGSSRVVQGSKVVKSGYATHITYGEVIDPAVALDVEFRSGRQRVNGFLIKPDPAIHDSSKPLADKGDSGAPWLIANRTGQALPLLAGLHVGIPAPGQNVPDGYRLACHIEDVFASLGLALWSDDQIARTLALPALATPRQPTPMLVATREAAILRGLPSETAARLGGLEPGQLVHVLSIRNGWATLSLKGDDAIDGFVWSDLLRQIS
jgi:hypothetical protein